MGVAAVTATRVDDENDDELDTDENAGERVHRVPLLQVIVIRSLEIWPVMLPPPNGPQFVASELGFTKLPVAVAPRSLVSDTELPL